MIDPSTGWIKIVEIPTFNLYEVTGGNDEYKDKPSSRVIQMFNNTWLYIYLLTHRVVFDNVSEFKQTSFPLIKGLLD